MLHDPYTHLTLHELRAAELRRQAAAGVRSAVGHRRAAALRTRLRTRLGELLIAWGARLTDASPAGAV